MFVYSVRASSVKFFGVILLSVVALIALIVFIPSVEASPSQSVFVEGSEINFDKIKTDEDRKGFLAQFGWEVTGDAEEEKVTIPDEFDKVFTAYNDIQREQGLDLSKYKRKEVMRYTYTLANYPDYDGTVYANVLVYRGKVIGGDICSADKDGFVHGFEKK